MTAATSVLEFMDYEGNAGTKHDLAQSSKFFEYGINGDVGTLDLNHLKNDGNIKRLLCFHHYNIYVSNFMEAALKNDKLAWRNELKLPSAYENQRFYMEMANFTKRYYYRWLYELSTERHDRKFNPFDLSIIANKADLDKDINGTEKAKIVVDENKLFTLVTGMPAKKSSFSLSKDRIKYDEVFSKMCKNLLETQFSSKERMVSAMLNKGIHQIIEERYNL